jgi:hypothetical protein
VYGWMCSVGLTQHDGPDSYCLVYIARHHSFYEFSDVPVDVAP